MTTITTFKMLAPKLAILVISVAFAAGLPGVQREDDVSSQWDPNCGTSIVPDAGSERPDIDIHGGWDALRGEWPWQISMRNGAESRFHYCGGSVINQDWVMTAAHCCEGELAANVYVVTGEHDFRETDLENPDRAVYRVRNIHMHPNYGPVVLYNDTCLLEMMSPITYNDYTGAVCKPQEAYNAYDGVTCSTSGWGEVESGPDPDILQTVNLYVVNNTHCYQEIREFQPTWVVTEDMICAGHGNYETRDTCQGDSGGPLVTKNAQGLWELIGLTSWGWGCSDSAPGVFARVNYFLDWYDEVMNPAN